MSRIRSIKPEFFTDEHLAELPPLDRLVFVGLWTIADKAGRLEDRPKRIKAIVLPYDSADMVKILDRLADAKFILRYEIDGQRLIQIRTWEKHQRVHHTEVESDLPSYNGDVPVRQPLSNGEVPDGKERKGKEGKGREGRGEVELFVAAWNEHTQKPIGQCRELTAHRRTHILARLKDRPLAEWVAIFDRINASPFCRGHNDRGWHADFDWVLQPDVGPKVLEGKYDPRAGPHERRRFCEHDPECHTQAEHRDRCLAEMRAAQGAMVPA